MVLLETVHPFKIRQYTEFHGPTLTQVFIHLICFNVRVLDCLIKGLKLWRRIQFQRHDLLNFITNYQLAQRLTYGDIHTDT